MAQCLHIANTKQIFNDFEDCLVQQQVQGIWNQIDMGSNPSITTGFLCHLKYIFFTLHLFPPARMMPSLCSKVQLWEDFSDPSHSKLVPLLWTSEILGTSVLAFITSGLMCLFPHHIFKLLKEQKNHICVSVSSLTQHTQ